MWAAFTGLFFHWQSLAWEIPAAWVLAMTMYAERYQRTKAKAEPVVRDFYDWAEQGL